MVKAKMIGQSLVHTAFGLYWSIRGLFVTELDIRLIVKSSRRVAVFRYLKYSFGIGKSTDEGVLSNLSTKVFIVINLHLFCSKSLF